MNTLYDRGFRKITTLSALKADEALLFRTGGSMLVLHRDLSNTILAADATHCVTNTDDTPLEQLAAVIKCLGAADSQGIDWKSLLAKNSLQVEVNDSEIWVCVDTCDGK